MSANSNGWIVDDEVRLAALADYGVLDSVGEARFDDIVSIASHICNTPVSLVSFVAADRQWFKAKKGFEANETDLERSVCAHVLAEPDVLVIPDLSLDARTRANPLVTGDPRIRFYAGAPLRNADGQTLGSLCVIDAEPRPEGLSNDQLAALRALARQVMDMLETRRSLAERDALLYERERLEMRFIQSEARVRKSEAYWRGLFERLDEGFLVGEVVRDADGRVSDWRYIDMNAAWSELVGITLESAIGRTMREVIPGVEDEWIDEFANVVRTGQGVAFTRQVGVLDRWYEGRAFPLDDERFGAIFMEVTARVREQARRDALLEIVERLRDADSVGEMTKAAAEIVGRTIVVSRAGFGRLDESQLFLDVETDWTAPGVDSIAGRHLFSRYGNMREELLRGDPLIIQDVRSDPRTSADPTPLLDLGIASLVNMPVREKDRTVAVLIVHHDRPQDWSPGAIAFLRNVADRLEASVARLKAESDRELMVSELNHRVKNTFAMVHAIATQTLRRVEPKEAVEAFKKRIQALSQAHNVLLKHRYAASDLTQLIEAALRPFDLEGRFDLQGEAVPMGPRTSLSTTLLLHELATNAVKYGALSSEAGRVGLTWSVAGTQTREIIMTWREAGGPLIHPPSSKSFGSRLIAMGLAGKGGVDLHFAPTGLEAEMRAPLDQLQF